MNSDTGKIYTEPATIEAAVKRGEKLIPIEISERAARNLVAGRNARAAALKAQRRKRDRLAKASRKGNRGR